MAASTNLPDKKQGLINSFNALSIYADCTHDDLEFNEVEKQKREREFLKKQKEREEEIKRREKCLKEDENEFRVFKCEEQRQLFIKHRKSIDIYRPNVSGQGRGRGGQLGNGLMEGRPLMRGRGRLKPEELKQIPPVRRETIVNNNSNQIAPSSNFPKAAQHHHNDRAQPQRCSRRELTGKFCPAEVKSANIRISNSSRTSEQFENGFDTPRLCTSTVQSNIGVQNSSLSPATFSLPSSPPPQTQKRKGSRLAAKFSNTSF